MRYGIFLLLCFSISSFAQNSNPSIGVWKLNLNESQFVGSAPQMDYREYRLLENGFITGLAIIINSDGKPAFLQFTAKSDGEFYPEYETNALSNLQAFNMNTELSYAEKILDVNKIEWTDKYKDRVTSSGFKMFSDDGRKMKIVVAYQYGRGEMDDYVLVYDKQ